MITYIKLWWGWATHCLNSWPYKIAVLFKLANSPTFEEYKAFASIDWNKYFNFNGGSV